MDRASNKVVLILRKEWVELRQQRVLLLGMLAPPLIFAVMPLAFASFAGQNLMEEEGNMPNLNDLIKLNPALEGMSPIELGQTLITQQFSILFLLLPVILPSVIASYSIIGEKTSRTLEPVLATPVSTRELLLAKCLIGVVPSVLITWLVATIFAVGLSFVAVSPRVLEAIISLGWLLVLLLCAPLLCLITVAATVAISSRVSDPRTAQQISVVLIIPIMALFFGQLTGLLILSPILAVIGAIILALLAAAALLIASALFQRETILTRWS
ncbi:MAG: ABC transporter permease subunit [Chloroflexia bacterium]